LKGFFDRVFIPGVSFTVGPRGKLVTNLQKLRKIAAVCTYGTTRTINLLLGDPPRRVVKRPATGFVATISPITIWIIQSPSSEPPF